VNPGAVEERKASELRSKSASAPVQAL
jgi:hypothetical protein